MFKLLFLLVILPLDVRVYILKEIKNNKGRETLIVLWRQ